MKYFRQKIARFYMKRPNFGISNLVRYIVIGMVAVFALNMMDQTGQLHQLLSFSPYHIIQGQVWRLFTFVFLPTTSQIIFFAIQLYVLYMLGTSVERTWGKAKFTLFILTCVLTMVIVGGLAYLYFMLGGPVFNELLQNTESASRAVGRFVSSQYILLSLLLVFATMSPNAGFRFFFIIPMSAKIIAFITVGLLAYNMFIGWQQFPANIIPLGLAVPYFLFSGDTLKENIGPRRTKTSTRFHASIHQAETVRRAKAHRFKCEVCGKTDVDYPDLEFRYCSQCVGHHCYCAEHIHDHAHRQD